MKAAFLKPFEYTYSAKEFALTESEAIVLNIYLPALVKVFEVAAGVIINIFLGSVIGNTDWRVGSLLGQMLCYASISVVLRP